jgi:hypothetical protein
LVSKFIPWQLLNQARHVSAGFDLDAIEFEDGEWNAHQMYEESAHYKAM